MVFGVLQMIFEGTVRHAHGNKGRNGNDRSCPEVHRRIIPHFAKEKVIIGLRKKRCELPQSVAAGRLHDLFSLRCRGSSGNPERSARHKKQAGKKSDDGLFHFISPFLLKHCKMYPALPASDRSKTCRKTAEAQE